MTGDADGDVKLEIGHVLFIDIVGYSKLLMNEQSGRAPYFVALTTNFDFRN